MESNLVVNTIDIEDTQMLTQKPLAAPEKPAPAPEPVIPVPKDNISQTPSPVPPQPAPATIQSAPAIVQSAPAPAPVAAPKPVKPTVNMLTVPRESADSSSGDGMTKLAGGLLIGLAIGFSLK